MPFFDQLISNPGAVSAVGQGVLGAKKKIKSGLAGTMIGDAAGIKPEGDNTFLSTDSGPKFKPIADPPPAPMIGFGHNGTSSSTPTALPAPEAGTARAWSSQGPAQANTPVQEFHVPTGPQPVHPQNQPAPIGRAWTGFHSSGEGDTGGGGGGGTTAAHNISSFYDSIGLPLSEAIGGAQRDEELAKHAWAQREGGEATTRALQQAGMAQGLESGPQNELAKRISELSTANLYNPTPEGSALIKHYIQQLQGLAPQMGHAGTGEQQEAPTPAATPTQTNKHPGFGGQLHSFLHGVAPGLAGAAGWAGGAMLAPETGGASFLVPATASLASYFGGNALMDKVDPGGAEAASEHGAANLGGQLAGGFFGRKGFGKLGAKAATEGATPAGTPEGGLSQKNPGANTGGPAGTIGAEAAPTPTTRPVRQMNPFGGGEMSPGETPIAPRSRQLTMGEMGAKASEPRTSAPTQTGTPQPSGITPANMMGAAAVQAQNPQPKVQMSGDPQVDAAVNAFKVQPGVHQAEQFSLPGMPEPQAPAQPSNVIPMPQQQQTQPAPGMQSTAIPQPRVVPMGVQPGGTNPRVPIATNPMQMPQQPSGVTTLNPALLDPQVLQRIIGDPRIGPAIVHDPAFYALIAKYMKTLEP